MCPGRCSGGFGNSKIVFHVSKSTIGQVGIETFLRLDVEKMKGEVVYIILCSIVVPNSFTMYFYHTLI